MLDSLFYSVLDGSTAGNLSPNGFGLCMIGGLAVGLLIAGLYTFKTKYTKGFFMTLVTLPAAVAMVIMMVNGSVGTGVAVAGAFSLIRFRSVPGTAKEISAIFLAMGAGLAVGLGYIGLAFLFAILVSAVNIALTASKIGEQNKAHKTLQITMPEHLDYGSVFDEVFLKYVASYQLQGVKTASMGSLFKLTYDIELKEDGKEKEFIDALRCRNGNLEISLNRSISQGLEL